MKTQLQTVLVSAALLAVVAGVSAQDQSKNAKPLTDALGRVAEHSGKACDGVDCVIAAVKDAKASNDPKKMRAALDLAEKELGESEGKQKKARTIAERVHVQMQKIDDQRARVKEEQQKLDRLEYPTDSFVMTGE